MNEEERKYKQGSRGRETLFRVTYSHQSKLIQIADYKANIIISVSTMIISGVVAIAGYGAVTDKVGDYGMNLVIPVLLILLTCLLSLIFAIQAARPKLIQSWKLEAGSRNSWCSVSLRRGRGWSGVGRKASG